MNASTNLARIATLGTMVCALAGASLADRAEASAVGYVVTSANVTNSGQSLVVYTVWARFNGPTDTLLNCFNLQAICGSSMTGFWHKDNAYYSSGVLTQEFGTWNPSQTGSTTLNRPFDSYLTNGGIATPTNTTNADPSWVSGGNADARSWNRPDLPNNGTLGWFNSNPPNLQGRVGQPNNTSTDVRIGQFVLSAGDAAPRGYQVTIGYNDGVAGSAVQFYTGTFALGNGPTPITWYRDIDGDGFGSLASGTQVACSPSAGYVGNNTDCNDALITYADNDGDTFGAGPAVACGVGNNGDCNDGNATLNPNTIWYRDTDGDGFGSSGDGTLVQCAQPAGYALQGNDNCPGISNPSQADCNANGIGDACEIASGALGDCDSDGIPDVCEGATVVAKQSPLLAPFGNGAPVSYTFTSLPRAYGASVKLHIDAIADLDLSSEFIAVTFDGGTQEFFFVAGGTDCPATPDRETKTFTIPAFNALAGDGALMVNLVASGTVSSTQCVNGGIRLRLEYTGLEGGSDCNNNGQLDSCEIGNGLAFDCNGNGTLDSCDVTAGLGTDCNGNGKLDSCDLASGGSTDLNGNGVLDECAGEFVVGGSGFASVQAAIDAVPAGGTVLIGPGLHHGPVVITGKRVTIATLTGAAQTTLSGAGLGTAVIEVNGAGAAGTHIEGLTIRDGAVGYDFSGYRVGGGIAVIAVPNFSVSSCNFVSNGAAYGGGVYCFGGSGSVTDCIFSGNSASVDGGALELGGADAAGWQVARCRFESNGAATGGAMHVWSAGCNIVDSVFEDNTATAVGGALSWYSPDSPAVNLDGCSVEANHAAAGGGLAVIAGTGAFGVTDTRFCRNTPEAIAGSYTNLGGVVFGQDCDGDGVCDIDEIADTASTSFVWDASAGGNGKRYMRVSSAVSWEKARARAEGLGGQLVSITSAAENAAIAAQLGNTGSWIGGFQDPGTAEPNGGWQWVSGEPWSYTNWNTGEPNDQSGEDRLMMGAGGGWNDSGCPGACFYQQGFIVEVDDRTLNLSRDCNGNGVPDGCDISGGASSDCNGNNIPDSCDIAAGTLADCNANGAADLCELGDAAAWGENTYGQASLPNAVDHAIEVGAGCNHGIALVNDGTVLAWGSNAFGQSTVPSSVANARHIAAGCDHNVVSLANGTVIAWGYNAFGQCTVPAAANGSVAQVAAGANHSGVRKSNGTLVLWGRNADGECTVPSALGPVVKVALGGAHSVGLRSDGSVLCWGLNNFGQCNVPANAGSLQSIAAGCYHTVGLRADGTVTAWGSTLFGQTTVPAGLNQVVAIAAGSGQHTLALRADGQVVAWGWNAFGQSTVPSGLAGIAQIAAGGTFSIAKRGSAVDCNGNGQVDSCEIATGGATDCNGNGLPDSCDIRAGAADCDLDGALDSCEIASNAALDCNGNGVLDSCDITSGLAFDCNGNGRLDSCDVAQGQGTDCNANGRLDSCDLASGASTDLNGNGVLDECAGEFVVGGSGFATVQAAIDAAPSGATVHVGPGAFTGGLTLTSKPLTIRSTGGASVTTLSGTGLDRSTLIVRTAAANGTVIDGFTFTGGAVGTAEFGTRLGGAVLLIETSADIRNCRFEGNNSIYGGAIYAYRYSGTIEDCAFVGNHATDDAGAIQLGFGGSFVFRDNLLQGNSCGRNGGAVQIVQWLDGPTTSGSLTNCQFVENTAGQEGSALAWYAASGSNLPIVNCTVEGNLGSSPAFDKLSADALPSLAFAFTGTRFCLNQGGNVDGPTIDNGGNTFSQDCNANGLCDADEIASGTVADCDHDGFPDSCQLGRAVAWGENASGQSTIPAGLGVTREISAGCTHALAVRIDGTVAAWGSNSFGQLALNGTSSAKSVAAGCDHSLVLKVDGQVLASGYNAFGQCNVPASANGNVAQIVAGANHSGVRKIDGSVILWGRNADGESTVPASLGPAASIALGGAHSVGLRADGTIACWGLNNFGQCNPPANIGSLRGIAAGCYHTVGLRVDGTVAAWGSSIFGQTTVPAGLSGVVAVAAGSGQHTLALKADGSVVSWGWNAFGQTTVPAAAAHVAQIAAGGTFSLVRTTGAEDCNNNGAVDSCEIAAGTESDCNANAILDSCEIAAGTSSDLDGNGRPDGCPGEWIVGGTGFPSIGAAIAVAPAGTVIRVAPGTYVEHLAITANPITLRSLGGAGVTTISGVGADASILAIRTAAASGTEIDGFTFRDGTVGTAAFGARVGGGLFLDNVSAVVRNCRFLDNASEFGGAIYAINYSGLIEANVFEHNHASATAGGVQLGFGGTCIFRGNTLTSNTAGESGGAMHIVNWETGPLTAAEIRDCTFTANTADISGAALSWYAGSGTNLHILGCTVESNEAPDAAFSRVAGNLAFAIQNSRFCLNTQSNVNGAISDLGGNIFSQDCNHNGVCDADEIASGAESDCNGNGIPDSCELAGRTVAFGDGGLGQLEIPADLGKPLSLAAGCDHSVVLRTDGTLIAWGRNTFGQAAIPSGLPTIREIAAGCDHNLALTQAGTVTAWGYNAYGQCNVPAITGVVVQLSAGANHSGVRRADGSLVLWGRNIDGECNVPAALGPASRLALGGAHSVALRANGTVLCWGLNNFGQCNVPAGAGTLQSIAAGCYHTVGLRTNGTVVAWGSSLFGQTSVPPGLSGVTAVAAGSGQHTLALRSDGSVVAWGWNAFGQATVPPEVSDVISIAAGGTHSLLHMRPAADCNGNNQLDSCELASGAEFDCNGNSTLDSCELAAGTQTDCNGNGALDSCEIASGTAADCNGNALPDTCDLAAGTSTDLNSNGRPDECAGECVVGGTGFGSIQAAINAAADGSTICVGPGVWSPFTLSGRQLTIRSIGGPATAAIDGLHSQRVVDMSNVAVRGVTVEGFVIRNGSATEGAGIRLTNASPTIRNCVIVGNVSTGSGGGIWCSAGSPLFEQCTITANAAAQGGGAYLTGVAPSGLPAQFDLCSVFANDSTGQGAGIFNASQLLLTGCQIEDNAAGGPGGGLLTTGAGSSAISLSYFCLNTPTNTSGGFADLGGNTFGDDCNSNGICDIDDIANGAEDKNQNNKLDTCELERGDLNLDGSINAQDLAVLLNFWGAPNPPVGDFNHDGVISAADLAIMLNNWGS